MNEGVYQVNNLASLEALRFMLPEVLLVLAVVAGIILDITLPKPYRAVVTRFVSLFGVLASLFLIIGLIEKWNPVLKIMGFDQLAGNTMVSILAESYLIIPLTIMFKLVILLGTTLLLLIAKDRAEFYYLALSAVLGAMFMVSSWDMITIFVGLELLSISSYVLVAMRRRNQAASEAGMKYLVIGGLSSAIILYGMSFLYGLTGETNIQQIQISITEAFATGETIQPMFMTAFFLIIAGIGFKIASAPFHAWAPDAYQGSNTSSTVFLATISKAAAMFLMVPLVYVVFFMGDEKNYESLQLVVQVLAVVSMVVGNILALRQSDVKRMLAYSGIANTGYLIIPFIIGNKMYLPEFFFFLIAYVLMNIGLFAVLLHIQNHKVNTEEYDVGQTSISVFAGLYYRAPFVAIAALIFIFSLAGLPLTAGFMGKWYILFTTFVESEYWIAATLLITTIISFYYYFGLIRQMFMRTGNDEPLAFPKITLFIGILVALIGTVFGGIFPGTVFDWIIGM